MPFSDNLPRFQNKGCANNYVIGLSRVHATLGALHEPLPCGEQEVSKRPDHYFYKWGISLFAR